MKLLHLADLHIGKRVNGFSMLEDQEYILNQILEIVEEHKPDGVMIAGDVYDKPVPPAEAVELLDDFLVKLCEKTSGVYMISGNHDSAERVSFVNRLLEHSGLHIAPVYDGHIEPVSLAEHVKVWMIPYTKPIHVKQAFPEEAEKITDYTSSMQVLVDHLELDPAEVNIAIAHQFLTSAATCESEERNIGALENVDSWVFDPFAYVALGHLHGPQQVGRETIRYAGSPLKYSFSEKNQKKSAVLLEIDESGQVKWELLPLKAKRDLVEIRGKFDDLISEEELLKHRKEDYYRIILEDEQDVPNAAGRLRSYYPYWMELGYDNSRTRAEEITQAAVEVEHRTPMDIFTELFESQNGKGLNDRQVSIMESLIEELGN